MRLSLLRSMVVRAVLNEAGQQCVVTAGLTDGAPMRISFHAANADPLASADAVGPSFLVSRLRHHGTGSLREQCRKAAAAGRVLGPCVLSMQDHTHSGLVFVVNPGEGTAALCAASGLFAATVQPDKFPRPAVFLARQISRASRSCAALRPAVRRARTLTHRITPRPRWARPG